MNSQSSQSRNTNPVEETVFFLVHKLREEVNAQVRRLLSLSGIDVEELESDLANGTESDTVRRARELVSRFSGDPYSICIAVRETKDTVKIEARTLHYFPINPVTLKVSKICGWCGAKGGDETSCPGSPLS